MARKFVKATGLHNIFNAVSDTSLDLTSIKQSVQSKVNETTIVFLTASGDASYGYPNDSKYIWTMNTLYPTNDNIGTDEKVKVNTSSSDATFPLMAINNSNPINGSTYDVIFDSGLRINPNQHSISGGYVNNSNTVSSNGSGSIAFGSIWANTDCEIIANGENSIAVGVIDVNEADTDTIISDGDGAIAGGVIGNEKNIYNSSIHSSGQGSIAYGYIDESDSGIYAGNDGAIAIGYNNVQAIGKGSQAFGSETIALGDYSHAECLGTQVLNTGEHAEGTYNKSNNISNIEMHTLHSVGIGTSDEDRRNAIEIMSNGNIYINGVGNYDGTNPVDAETLQNSLVDLIPITYEDLLSKVNSKLLIPGKKYLITDYITKINNSDFTSLEKEYDGIICEAISNFELSRVNCKAVLSYESSEPSEDVYIWIDNFPESIIENEPDILQNYHNNFREYFNGSKLHRLGQIEFESESYWLWEYVTNNGFGSNDWIPNVQYALTLESDFEGNTLLDDVTNVNRPILYYLGSDKSQIDYGSDGDKHDEYAWVVVKQEKYTYDPTTITSNTIYVEKFSYDPLSSDIDQSYYEETNFYEEGAGTTNEYKLRGTLEWDDNEFYLWELTSGHALDVDQLQYSWMLTKTADFRGLSLQDDYENNRYCPCFCFLNEDKSEAYLDENDNYQNHEILLIQAVYDPSLPEVEPLSGGSGETKDVEYEIGYDITKQFDGHKGTILYMQDEYGNSANFDFKNIKSKKYGFLFGGENDLTLDGTYKENKVLGELREFSICSETCYGSTFTQNCLGTIYQDLENCEVSYDNNQFVVFDPYHHETLNAILIEHQKNLENIDTVASTLLVNHEDRIRELEAKIEQLMNA